MRSTAFFTGRYTISAVGSERLIKKRNEGKKVKMERKNNERKMKDRSSQTP
jgi:hypothetical protein